MKYSQMGFATRAIHQGYDPLAEKGALTPPVHMASTFAFETAAEGAARFAGETEGHIYSRISNPTVALLEDRVADLEGAEAGVATASGMGAINAVMWTFLAPGDEVITDKTLYGCTFSFLRHGLERFGVKITHVDLTKPDNLDNALNAQTKIVYFETPANPNMRLIDIAACAVLARDAGARTIVDNTYSTPYLTQPISLGADIVVHSATKYLGGHGDLIGGIAVGNSEDMANVRMIGVKDMTGAVMAPLTAMLIMRGLKTLELRMARHCESARVIAEQLNASEVVKRVYYPGLKSGPQHDLARAQMKDFGGMIAFELKGGLGAGVKFMDALSLITRAVSLGDAETLIQHPASMTHSTYTPEERLRHGISDGLVRLSVGLEDLEDIAHDLAVGLKAGGDR